MGSITPLPYWQINVSSTERTPGCPPFLQNLSAKDLNIISTPDSHYRIISWTEVQTIIRQNRLDLFQRIPSQLRRYLEYNYGLKQRYGSVMEFVLSKRLHWTIPITPTAAPFKDDSDIKILYNDWPYGIDPKIVHLVVWTKFILEDDPQTGDLTDRARAEIESYVEKTFVNKVGVENVIWFKNWKSLKSVHAVEHFHVMLYDPSEEFLEKVTGGDVPLSRKI